MVFTVLGRATGSGSPADRSQLQSRTPRIYHVTPEILEPATSDTTSESQTTTGRQKANESARHQLEDLPDASDATGPTPRTLALRKSRATGRQRTFRFLRWPGGLLVFDVLHVGGFGLFGQSAFGVGEGLVVRPGA